MDEHVQIEATVTDRWGGAEAVYCGQQPTWAWDLDRCAEWRKMKRRELLAERTSDPHGWRVTFAVLVEA